MAHSQKSIKEKRTRMEAIGRRSARIIAANREADKLSNFRPSPREAKVVKAVSSRINSGGLAMDQQLSDTIAGELVRRSRVATVTNPARASSVIRANKALGDSLGVNKNKRRK